MPAKTDLIRAAEKYFRLGIPVVPFRIYKENGEWAKKPLVSWGKWIDEKQSEEEFNALPWSGANGFAIVCGCEVEGHGHICVFDLDLDYREALDKLRKWPEFIITRMERTVNNRLHLIYYSKTPVPSITRKDMPLELKGRGSLCILAPSQGYVKMNDSMPAEIDNAYEYFLRLCRLFGYELEPEFDREVEHEKLEQWLQTILSSGKVIVMGHGPNYIYCRCPFHPPDQHPSFVIHRRKYYAVDYHDARIFNLRELARELDIELPTDKEKKPERAITEKKPKRYITGGEMIDGHLLTEVIDVDGSPKLLIYDPETGEYGLHDMFEGEGAIFQAYPDLPFRLPGAPEKIDDDPTLWADTIEFIKQYYDNPRNDDVYHILTAAVAWSYFYRDIRVSTPFILFLGPWRSGKTRALEVMASLCYKAMSIVDPSEASIFRLIEELRPTLIIDEAQIIDKNIRAIMAAAYRYGMKVPRVIDPEADGLDGIKWFDVFSFIIYASREEPPSDIFSRSIVIHCEKNVRPTSKTIDEDTARRLRTRWLAQRLRLHGKVKISFDEFASDDGRLQELLSPLIVMARLFGGDEAVRAIERYGRELEAEIRGMESTTDDALIIESLISIIQSRPGDAPEYVAPSDIADHLNDGLAKPSYTPEYIGRRMTALGFKRKKIHGGKRVYLIDYGLLERLARRYGITWEADLTASTLL